MEGAVVLAGRVQCAQNVVAALRHYEAQRSDRTAYITNLSWRLGKISQWENHVARWLRNTFMRAVPMSRQQRQLAKVLELEIKSKC